MHLACVATRCQVGAKSKTVIERSQNALPLGIKVLVQDLSIRAGKLKLFGLRF